MKITLFLVIILLVTWVLYSFLRVTYYTRISKELVGKSTPFTALPPDPTENILIIGDSLGVGVGSSEAGKSIAGLLGKDHPNAKIQNLSVSGSRIHDGLLVAQGVTGNKFDLVIIQLGANDITHLSKMPKLKEDLASLLTLTKTYSKEVIYLSSGNVGYAPIFPFPINKFLTIKSNTYFKMYEETANESRVTYIDLNYPKAEDPFSTNIDKYYAADLFHVTDAGYELWYQKIKQQINK